MSVDTNQAVKAAEDAAARQEQELILAAIAKELSISLKQVRTTVGLLDEGNTIPFIARYRKEMTGELDENVLRDVEERLGYLRNLGDRKKDVIRSIEEQGKLTPELQASIMKAVKLQEVEDLYRPFKQKRKTRASVAKERGLEPLADWVMEQRRQGVPLEEAAKYIDADRGVESAELALQGGWISLPRILPMIRISVPGCASIQRVRGFWSPRPRMPSRKVYTRIIMRTGNLCTGCRRTVFSRSTAGSGRISSRSVSRWCRTRFMRSLSASW